MSSLSDTDGEEKSKRISERSWGVLAVTILPAAFLMQFDRQAMIVLAPMIQREFHFDLVTITHILSAMAVCYAICQIPSAWFTAKFGPALTIALCLAGWSLAVILTAFASGPISLLFLRGALGAVQAPDWVASVMMLKSEVPTRLRSRAAAALFGAGYIGKILSGPISAQLAGSHGWRFTFVVFGVIGLMLGAFLILALKRWRSFSRHTKPSEPIPFRRILDYFKHPRFHFLAIAYLFFSGGQSFVVIMLPLYLKNQRHSSLTEIGWLASAPYVALYLALVTAGIVSDAIYKRTGSLFISRVPLATVALFGSGACFAMAISMRSTSALMGLLCVGMMLVGVGQVVFWAIIQDATQDVSGYLAAWVQVFVWLGLWLGPVMMASVVAAHGGNWDYVRILLLAFSFAAGSSLLIAQSSLYPKGQNALPN